MLQVKQFGEEEWEFVYPPKYEQLQDRFHEGIELWEVGDLKLAEKIYKEVIQECPEFIDAYHHLGLVYEELDKEELAFDSWLTGYRMGRQVLPSYFMPGKHLLRWARLDNRPFLRCTHAFGLYFFQRGNLAKDMEIFEFMISVNPNDNQGIRALLVEGYLKMGNYLMTLDVCDRYPEDCLVDLVYGRPYALFKMGDKKRATLLLREAVKLLPKVARELLKKKHPQPESFHPGRVTVGGADEAYYYWEESGILWKDPEVESWLTQNVITNKS